MQISGLNESLQFGADDVLAIEINGVTYKLTGTTLASTLRAIGGALPIGNGGTGGTTVKTAGENIGLRRSVTNQITLTSTEGTISQYTAVKSAGAVYVAFVFTPTVAKSAGQSYTINMAFSDTALRPGTRSYAGGGNSAAVKNAGVAPNTSTAAYIYVNLSAATSAGSQFWVTVTYPCADLS